MHMWSCGHSDLMYLGSIVLYSQVLGIVKQKLCISQRYTRSKMSISQRSSTMFAWLTAAVLNLKRVSLLNERKPLEQYLWWRAGRPAGCRSSCCSINSNPCLHVSIGSKAWARVWNSRSWRLESQSYLSDTSRILGTTRSLAFTRQFWSWLGSRFVCYFLS